jgi:hypothetical protein
MAAIDPSNVGVTMAKVRQHVGLSGSVVRAAFEELEAAGLVGKANFVSTLSDGRHKAFDGFRRLLDVAGRSGTYMDKSN